MAGFLFGFDMVVISGAEKTIKDLWSLSDAFHGVAIGSALWGTVVGSLLGAWPTDRYGRRKTLLGIGSLYLISAIWSALAPEVWSFMLARFLGGIAIGVSTVAAPLYISEIAPPKKRGLLTCMFQFNIVFGILVAYLSNSLLADLGENAWRWMLGVVAIPSLVYCVMTVGIPESPRWLMGLGNSPEEGLRVLRLANPTLSPEELSALAQEILASNNDQVGAYGFWTRRLSKPILLAFLVAFFNQMSGINAILFFAPRIFGLAGMSDKAALLQSVGIGVTNFIFTFVGLWLIDLVGRRTLLFVGSVGYILSLGLLSWAFFSETYRIVPACLFGFIAAHAVGQGAVIWVLISEIFPNQHRAMGQTLGSFTHWIFAALLTTFFPIMVSSIAEGYVFLFFCFMMVLHLLWVFLMVPETKGVPLEQIEKELGIR